MNRRNAVILIILFVIALVGISFFGGPVPYIFLMLTLLVPATCILYIFLVIASLKIYQRSDGRTMVASTPSDFYITLNNETFFSFSSVKIRFYSSFSTVSGLDEDSRYELPPHTSITRATKLICRYRGEYKVGIKEIEVRDPLGLFTVTYRIKEPLEVIVAPAMVNLESLRLDLEQTGAGKDTFTNPSDADVIVREYVPGDDTRMIHHKASAVMRKPMVRQRIGNERTGVAIIMEKGRYSDRPEDYLPVENRIIESALALALYYTGRSIPADVIYRTDRTICEAVRSHADYERLYTSMRSYTFTDADDRLMMFDELVSNRMTTGYRMLIFILANTDENVCNIIGTMNDPDLPIVIYTTGEEPDDSDKVMQDRSLRILGIGTKKPTEDVL